MTRPTISLTTKLQRSDKPVAVDMGGETVMMDIDMGAYFALTGSGTFIWGVLEKPATLNDIVQAIQKEFDVSKDARFEEAVAQFVSDLVAKGLVHEAD